MNHRIIISITGKLIQLVGCLMIFPILIGLFYGEKEFFILALVAGISIIAGSFLRGVKVKNERIRVKEGFVVTALSWFIFSVIGAIPFWASGTIPSITDAIFETASGFTTTGASILSNVEELPRCLLFWRSFTHWIGGMGILVFMLAIIPLTGGSNFNLMRAESPGPSVSKLAPKLKSTAQVLYRIYIVLTVIEFLLLVIFKMPVFDAVTLTLGTAGTGGFGIRNTSIADYSTVCQWIITVFMILFGINFNAYFFIFMRQFKKIFGMEEIRAYLVVILLSTAAISLNILKMCEGIFDAVTKAAFQVASIITTTGYSTTDFDLWPTFSKYILVFLMFMGACAGSTGGGIKISRIIVAVKTFLKETGTYIHPKSIRKLQVDKHPLEHDVIRSVNVYLITYIMICLASILLLSIEGKDMTTTVTAVFATLNNIGPGLGDVGPMGNFYDFNLLSKLVMIFDMIAGRLELFPLLILFHPSVWKALISQRVRRQ